MTISTPLNVLGIEASCDDSSIAQIRLDGTVGHIEKIATIGQADLHQKFGGVVPEIAARAHAESLDIAYSQAGINIDDIDLIAVTTGPGLIGGLHASNAFVRALASSRNIPMIGVNHLAGHALTPCLSDNLKPPFLMLLVSGGHCQFLIIHDYDEFERIGTTIDDSPGEAFDKVAKILGLGYPGGPEIEREAAMGNPERFALPRPLVKQDNLNFSFSGLKTATRRICDQFSADQGGMTKRDRADLCASFQNAVADIISIKSARAVKIFTARYPNRHSGFAIAGGVAANQTLRDQLIQAIAPTTLVAPPLSLCTDNAAMIAYAGGMKYLKNEMIDMNDHKPRPRWPLDSSAQSMLGSGKRGAKV